MNYPFKYQTNIGVKNKLYEKSREVKLWKFENTRDNNDGYGNINYSNGLKIVFDVLFY